MYLGRISSVMLAVLLLSTISRGQVDCASCHTESELSKLAKTMGLTEKAVGVMDKGQLQNNTGNFGELASYHTWFTNAMHWPRSAREDRQYAFGLGLVVGINDTNVIETVTQTRTKVQDWLRTGCRAVWLVDPADRTIDIHAGQQQAVKLTVSDELTGGDVLPGFHIPVAEIFAA